MTEQTLNVTVKVNTDAKNNIRKAGKTILVKPNNNVDIDEKLFNDIEGLISTVKTEKTSSYFLTFDTIDNSIESLKTLKQNNNLLVKFAHYKVFFTMTGLTDETDYNDIKTKHIKLIEDKTNSKVLYYKLYRNKSYLGCGDLTIDTKEGIDKLLDKDIIKEFNLENNNTGIFYKYNRKTQDDNKHGTTGTTGTTGTPEVTV